MRKRLLIIVAGALAASGCVTDSPLLVTGIFSLDPTNTGACVDTGTTALGGGSLDLAGGGLYQVLIDVQSDLDATLDTKADTATLATGLHRNTVLLDTVTFTYTSVPAIAFVQEATPLAFVLPPATKSHIRGSILNRKAIEKLFETLPGPTTDVVDLKVKIVFSGAIVSGGRLSTVPITFPISVRYDAHVGVSGSKCTAPGDTLGLTGPCGAPGGQDGAPLCCTPSDSTCAVKK